MKWIKYNIKIKKKKFITNEDKNYHVIVLKSISTKPTTTYPRQDYNWNQ
jgi:hypothetical protein